MNKPWKTDPDAAHEFSEDPRAPSTVPVYKSLGYADGDLTRPIIGIAVRRGNRAADTGICKPGTVDPKPAGPAAQGAIQRMT